MKINDFYVEKRDLGKYGGIFYDLVQIKEINGDNIKVQMFSGHQKIGDYSIALINKLKEIKKNQPIFNRMVVKQIFGEQQYPKNWLKNEAYEVIK